MANERIKLDGRLGFSLDISKDELGVLTGADRTAATELLVNLVKSNQCCFVGDTYFPVEWNEEIVSYDDEEYLSFDLPQISLGTAFERTNSLNTVLEESPGKPYAEQERSVTLTNEQWNRLACYILMTTNYREGERGAWLQLSTEKHPNGEPVFPHAKKQADYWKSMGEDLELMRKIIDGVSIDEKLADAISRAENPPSNDKEKDLDV